MEESLTGMRIEDEAPWRVLVEGNDISREYDLYLADFKSY